MKNHSKIVSEFLPPPHPIPGKPSAWLEPEQGLWGADTAWDGAQCPPLRDTTGLWVTPAESLQQSPGIGSQHRTLCDSSGGPSKLLAVSQMPTSLWVSTAHPVCREALGKRVQTRRNSMFNLQHKGS